MFVCVLQCSVVLPTCVRAQVGLQVGTLEVGLLAAREVAQVVAAAGEVSL